ncbi:uncharacterized protein BX663DRAFT_535472 [Cokeromyces recurvatus]|uniref:uncharacterized protein n=1 Tax=Cokeromyces recurvatus TaxID=90255 RepID=UPI002220A89C|nr:uncharacterized protein BX663DRAFT_535472 [Cokeromyces recurvatus]KAI7904501.1 hypothetical protein BX663DRAFT_535472 [Cokeromyces recurvatus]
MASERATLVLGGAALGAVSYAAYQKLTLKKPTTLKPTVVNTQPSPQPSPNTFEKARSILPFGFPGPVNDVIYRNAYVTSYNRRDRNPNWVAEHLTAESLKRGADVDRQKSTFKEDDHIPEKFRAKLNDYFKSGFDRGHMVPAADTKNSQLSMNETFYLTNIAPQVGQGFNRDYWAYVEHFCRQLTQKFKDVYIFTGPLYLPYQDPSDGKFYIKYQVIGNPAPNVAVPTHFYKVIMTQDNQGHYSVGAFVLPNQPIPDETPLTQFQVPLDAVERGSGLVFFEKLGEETKRRLPDLCRQTECKVVIRKFNDAAAQKQLPAK